MGCRTHVPVWHEATTRWVQEGRLVLLGVTQEQHPDRCRLFAQWQRLGWPILHDPINLLESSGVPIFVAIDEHGIVRSTKPQVKSLQADFLDRVFPDDAAKNLVAPRKGSVILPGQDRPDFAALHRHAEAGNTGGTWRELGDALVLWGGASRTADALAAYSQALRVEPRHGPTLFRLGVCYRQRYDAGLRQAGDFQAAVDSWNQALALDPNQYIWRRRIQQYGPRLDKPYAFYDWVAQAEQEITARGEKVLPLAVRPVGAEIAHPVRAFQEEEADAKPPDPEGKILRDTRGLIDTEVTVVPTRVQPGQSLRVHVMFRPDGQRKAHWNNEAEPLRLWVDASAGWQVSRRLLAAPPGVQPATTEARALDFEVKAPAGARGKVRLTAYALYYVCEDIGGKCLFLRKDIPIDVDVGP